MRQIKKNHSKIVFWRIAWVSLRTGIEGHGNWLEPNTFPNIIQFIKTLNKKYPSIDHWVEVWNRRGN